MDIRKYEGEADYEDLMTWWDKWKFSRIPPVFLPSNGWVVSNGDKKLGMVFVYMTDSAGCWMEWLTTNPYCTKQERKEALDMLIKSVQEYAIENKYLCVFTSTVHSSLKKLFPEHGFQTAEQNVSHFLWLGGLNAST